MGWHIAEALEVASAAERAVLVGVVEVGAVASHDQRVGWELGVGRETPLAAKIADCTVVAY